ncbi:MAG TPA: DUF1922 domain-containing protein [Candidatus Lokiarchaeia archaeon]|nr:DUF1922 domain-containing protein [Candidatus Lokiarchaeia archaeon]
MDRIIINCKKCGRPLAAIPGMKTRKCAACGASTKIPLIKQERPVPIKEARDVATNMAKKPEQMGTTAVIKRRVAEPRGDA